MAPAIAWLEEFQVNTGDASIGSQNTPHIVGLSNGNILVAWRGPGDEIIGQPSGSAVLAKLYDAEGNVIRDTFVLAGKASFSGPAYGMYYSYGDFDIAATGNGGFAMVYVGNDAYVDNHNSFYDQYLVSTRFDAEGLRSGPTTSLASASDYYVPPSAIANPNVSFNHATDEAYITYEYRPNTDPQSPVFGVIVAADGTKTGPFNASLNADDGYYQSDVVVLADGSMAVSYVDDFNFASLAIRSPSGSVIADFQIGEGSNMHLASLSDGGFVVAWRGYDSSTNTYQDKFEIFDNSGSSLVGPIDTEGRNITALPDGRFVVVYIDSSSHTLEGQIYNSNGLADGAAFVIENIQTSQPGISVTGDGKLLFTWIASGGDGEIYASIWDPRTETIDAVDYHLGQSNFVDTTVLTAGRYGSTVLGSDLDESLLGQQGADTLNGGGGNDLIAGGGGSDTLRGGAGDDTFISRNGDSVDNVDGGSGHDLLDTSLRDETSVTIDMLAGTYEAGEGFALSLTNIEDVLGTHLDDTIFASNVANLIRGGPGADTINGQAGDDHLFGDDGIDTISGGSGSDRIEGGAGRDLLFGAAGNDHFTILNGEDADNINGGGGEDTFDAGRRNDLMLGFNLSTGSYTLQGPENFAVGIENVIGTQLGDSITGNVLSNILLGAGGMDMLDAGEGDDFLYGGVQADTLLGGVGNDFLDGQFGADVMRGGAGNDIYIIDSAGDVVDESVAGSNGFDIIRSSITTNMSGGHFLGGIEAVTLTGSAAINAIGSLIVNILTGNEADNVLNGLAGADTMRGLGGNDTYIIDNAGDTVDESLVGSSGLDRVVSSVSVNLGNVNQVAGAIERVELTGTAHINAVGNLLFNRIVGNSGNNYINGLGGSDMLTGGDGSDTFSFTTAPGIGVSGNVDTITDFTHGVDRFALDDAVFSPFDPGSLSDDNFRVLGSGTIDADDFLLYNSSNGALYYDADGSGSASAQIFAIVTPGTVLTAAADFLVI